MTQLFFKTSMRSQSCMVLHIASLYERLAIVTYCVACDSPLHSVSSLLQKCLKQTNTCTFTVDCNDLTVFFVMNSIQRIKEFFFNLVL